ncbi:hypothetical protein CRYUN_Cryun11dG0013000 [Craigia yunnanensis]
MSSENVSTTPSLTAIESAIQLIDVKKAELKKAFDDLQANSLHLSSFSISWSDLDSHFTAIQNSVSQRFRLLESRDSTHHPVDVVPVPDLTRCSTHPSKQGDSSALKPLTRQDQVDSVNESVANRPLNQLVPLNGEQPSSSNSVGLLFDGSASASSRIDSVVIRQKIKELCERMDGKGLRKYINYQVKEREAIRMELPGALKSAPDPGAMVLDAMEGFYKENSQSKGNKDPELFGLRRVCMFLLEQLMKTGVSFCEEVRERAKKLALEWKAKVRLGKDNSLETLAFLHLVATYGLGAEVDKEELVGYFFNVARYREATMLCRSIGLGEKVHDLIQKLLDSGKQLFAVRFVFEFGLAKKFPPVPLLEDYLKKTKRLAKQVCKDGKDSLKSQNEATTKEIGALKAVIKIIEQHKLETEHSQVCLQKRIEQLEKQQADRKHPAILPAAKPQQVSQQAKKKKKKKKKQAQGKQPQSGNKRPKTTASVIHTVASLGVAGSSSAVPPFQHSHLQPAGLLPDHSASYMSLLTASLGVPGSSSAVPPFQQSHLQPAGLLPDHSASYMSLPPASFGLAGSSSAVPPFQHSHLQPAGLLPDHSASYMSLPTASLGVPGSSSAVPPFQQSHLQPAGLLPDHSASYMSLPPASFGLAGSSSAVSPFQQSHLQPAGLLPDHSASYMSLPPGSLSVAGSSSAVPPFQQSHLQPPGLLPDHSASYRSTPPGPYGMAGSTPAVNPYVGSSAALYDLAGALLGFSVNPNPAASHLYSNDRLPTYGAYGLPPQYHPSYHPQ